MSLPTITFPIDFKDRPPVRYLAKLFNDPMVVFRLWWDFAATRTDFRTVKLIDEKAEIGLKKIDWENCGTIWQINDCLFGGDVGLKIQQFIEAAIDQNLIQLKTIGGKNGLFLCEFASLNPQYFNSRQQKGGVTKGVNSDARESKKLAEATLFSGIDQEAEMEGATQAELQNAHALINQLRRALGEESLHANHPPDLLQKAVELVRTLEGDEEVKRVCVFLTQNRDNPTVDKRLDKIIEKFSSYR